jgi:prolyl-tRNA synthetase
LYKELIATGKEVLIDDRSERAGVKFKDADLIGIPLHIVIGERNLKENLIEIKERKTRETTKIELDKVVDFVQKSSG